MYIPEWFRIKDESVVLNLIREHGFATVYSQVDGAPFASHIPVAIESESPLVLIAHVAAQNPQVESLDGIQQLLIVFQGPHAYVSPTLYETSPNVPTWNYVAVHATGTAKRVDDEDELLKMLDNLVGTYDPNLKQELPQNTDHDYYRSKLRGLVAFRIHVSKLEGKAKLSQNKPARDLEAVKSAFGASERQEELEISKLMGG